MNTEKKTATQIINEYLDRQSIQARITALKTCKVTKDNAVSFALEYSRYIGHVQSTATARKLESRYRKAYELIHTDVESAREFRDAARELRRRSAAFWGLDRLLTDSEAYEHLGNCPTTSGVAFDGECACYETKLEMKGGRA